MSRWRCTQLKRFKVISNDHRNVPCLSGWIPRRVFLQTTQFGKVELLRGFIWQKWGTSRSRSVRHLVLSMDAVRPSTRGRCVASHRSKQRMISANGCDLTAWWHSSKTSRFTCIPTTATCQCAQKWKDTNQRNLKVETRRPRVELQFLFWVHTLTLQLCCPCHSAMSAGVAWGSPPHSCSGVSRIIVHAE